uniref:Semaphorin 4B n=1 Tax=Leptobrachium leishanense TaxID=445787 RepID=A0A8C5M3Z3_9ANUR
MVVCAVSCNGKMGAPTGSPERTVSRFEADGLNYFTTLLLSKDGSTLYIGGRESLFSLNSSNFMSPEDQLQLEWKADDRNKKECFSKGKDSERDCQNYIKILLPVNSTHLYTCGTYAFSPNCTYIRIADFSLETSSSGNVLVEDCKGRCPFDPKYKTTAIMVDGEMYAGTISNFQGNDPIIYKSHDSRISLKTENALNWLQDPVFVGSAHIPESLPQGNPVGDDDKVYFFFSESGTEFDFFENTIVSRIARVCKGDLGGDRVLQRRWTSFLKAQLLCIRQEDGFPFNVLQDMFVLTPGEKHWNSTIFYGVFTSQWNRGGAGGSAVCAFNMHDVQKAFDGLYKEVNRETRQWYTYTHSVPEPRPGACITNKVRNMKINSSLQMPDRVLNFIKDHFLMDSAIRSNPLLLQPQMRYQQISVQRVRGLTQTFDVMFLGTDDGRLHKAVSVAGKEHIIEEIKLFKNSQPVEELLIDHNKGLVYVSSRSMVLQIPVSNCSMYRTCGECILARDPYCAWSKKGCHTVPHHTHMHEAHLKHWVQDVENADTEKHCKNFNNTISAGRFGPVTEDPLVPCEKVVLDSKAQNSLSCKLLSNLANRLWIHNGKEINSSYLVLQNGDLILLSSPERLGTYECWSLEDDFRKLMVKYCVEPEGVMKKTTTTRSPKTEVVIQSVSVIDKVVNSSSFVSSKSHSSKSYWYEFLIMTALFIVVVVTATLIVLYKKRNQMKSILKTADHADKQNKSLRKNGKPAESLPLNGTSAPIPASDHKGYQTLNDNYIISTPVHDPVNMNAVLASEKRPLNVKDTHVEISPSCQRPRVRLGSEIRDSVV